MGKYKISNAFKEVLIVLGLGTAQYYVGKVWGVKENMRAETSGSLKHIEVTDGISDIKQGQKAIQSTVNNSTETIQKGQEEVLNAINKSTEIHNIQFEKYLNKIIVRSMHFQTMHVLSVTSCVADRKSELLISCDVINVMIRS